MAENNALKLLGARLRQERVERGWTLRVLAERAHLSTRFLMDVESGRGNISVRRLVGLADALQLTAAHLLTARAPVGRRVIALLGLRGAGKTTIGRRLAKRLGCPFVEVDQQVAARAGMSLSEIFSFHGEEYYRRLEREIVVEQLELGTPRVLAVGGGLVTSSETFARLKRGATTVWLKARPQDYWSRVMKQGDRRPIDAHPQARDALRALVARRDPLYAQAEITVDTTGLTPTQALDRVARAV